ncbi:hypothetical protein DFR24_2111 [Panacagrimonas perspica]|uniref:Uncharacterized protein n=1 Tax=Panacagrimonas perspica TaxID=381431 RepID=A0A4R7PGD6_9GAMM|nr:hypothetical protein DFR24_2111 [Panacagrimonas perspica]
MCRASVDGCRRFCSCRDSVRDAVAIDLAAVGARPVAKVLAVFSAGRVGPFGISTAIGAKLFRDSCSASAVVDRPVAVMSRAVGHWDVDVRQTALRIRIRPARRLTARTRDRCRGRRHAGRRQGPARRRGEALARALQAGRQPVPGSGFGHALSAQSFDVGDRRGWRKACRVRRGTSRIELRRRRSLARSLSRLSFGRIPRRYHETSLQQIQRTRADRDRDDDRKEPVLHLVPKRRTLPTRRCEGRSESSGCQHVREARIVP